VIPAEEKPTPPAGGEPEIVDDVALMARVRDGDRDAFVTLVRRHQQPLMNFFWRLGVRIGEAEDLAQETFIRLYRYRLRYRPRAKFTTFLYLLARQVRIDALRRARRREALADELENEQRVLEQETGAAGIRAQEALDAVRRLPEAMRWVLTMSLNEGLRYDEIAEALGIPVGTVKSRVFNALKRLRDELGTN
jgi:RNA polymerase sigma-70 factor (ECF subfamily)